MFSTENAIAQISAAAQSGKVKRVCIQTLNYPSAFDEVCSFVKALKQRVPLPVSVSCQPLNSENVWALARAGVDRIGVALDAATEKLFDKIKGFEANGPYKWEDELTLLRIAVGVFGEGNVSTHLIVGLGETEKEAANFIQLCVDMGVLPALFAFTPVPGTILSSIGQPPIEVYRRIQLVRHLIVNGLVRYEDVRFDNDGIIVDFGVGESNLEEVISTGRPFQTSGCPHCNRPFYNEKPSGPIYNYPRRLSPEEIAEAEKQSSFLSRRG